MICELFIFEFKMASPRDKYCVFCFYLFYKHFLITFAKKYV